MCHNKTKVVFIVGFEIVFQIKTKVVFIVGIETVFQIKTKVVL